MYVGDWVPPRLPLKKGDIKNDATPPLGKKDADDPVSPLAALPLEAF